uniref:Uncharacterized protein n=1 Tax=Arundo donax TaxID=35708 RepID=A0A0A9PWB0_ARUDO
MVHKFIFRRMFGWDNLLYDTSIHLYTILCIRSCYSGRGLRLLTSECWL